MQGIREMTTVALSCRWIIGIAAVSMLYMGQRAVAQCPPGEAGCHCDPCMCSPDPCCGSSDPCCADPCSCSPLDPSCDQDGDGVPNWTDGCPTDAGSPACNGCPDFCGTCEFVDCNQNLIADACDIANHLSTDFNTNGIPDDCEADCNHSGIPDDWEVQQGLTADCNGNQLPDACDIASKVMEDCNANGIGDECEKQVDVVAVSPRFSPIGFGAPVQWDLQQATSAASLIWVKVRSKGDLAAATEWLDISFGDSGSTGAAYRAFLPQSRYQCENGCAGCICPDCEVAFEWFSLSQEAFNNAIRSDGTLQVRAVASIAVDAGHCFGDTWIEFELHYTGAAAPDCNANGLLDSCELAAGYAVDANGNGVIDDCEAPITQCPGDYDFDQAITGQDLSLLLAAWGTANQQVDLTGDGQVDGNDMAVLLAGWGTCAD